MKTHSTCIFLKPFYYYYYFEMCIRVSASANACVRAHSVCRIDRLYIDKRLPFTLFRFGIHSCRLCHLFAAIPLPNPLITHDKTQQRDKIAVKINDLKQKYAEPNRTKWGSAHTAQTQTHTRSILHICEAKQDKTKEK